MTFYALFSESSLIFCERMLRQRWILLVVLVIHLLSFLLFLVLHFGFVGCVLVRRYFAVITLLLTNRNGVSIRPKKSCFTLPSIFLTS